MSDAPTYRIGSVDNALRLLALVAERRRVRLTDAAHELGVALSTAHRLMRMLQHHGLVVQDADSKVYAAGPALLRLGRLADSADVREVALPHLRALVGEAGETVHLWGAQGETQIVCLASVESPHPLRVGARTGAVLPAHATASGRALLAGLSDARVAALYPGPGLEQVRPATIATLDELLETLATVRACGYAVQRDECDLGVSAVAAAVPDANGPATVAIAIAVPSQRMPDDAVAGLGEAVLRCAARVAASARP